jgi:hypothetical protein
MADDRSVKDILNTHLGFTRALASGLESGARGAEGSARADDEANGEMEMLESMLKDAMQAREQAVRRYDEEIARLRAQIATAAKRAADRTRQSATPRAKEAPQKPRGKQGR